MFTVHLQPCQAAEDMKDFSVCARQLGEIVESIDSLINPHFTGNRLPTIAAF